MNRFHPSMSWNESSKREPNEPGPSESDYDHEMDTKKIHGVSCFPHQTDSPAENGWSFHNDVEVDRSWAHRSAQRNYFLPLHYEPNYEYPLIIWLHSNGFNEHQVDHVMPHISLRNYIAAGVRGVRAADSIGHRFDWHDSPAAIHAAHDAVGQTIEEASQQFSVHSSRIVLAGYGSGGTMAIRIAMREPERFAAVVSLGGPMPSGGQMLSNLTSLRERRLPMLWLWGAENPQFDADTLKEDIRLAMMIKAGVDIRQYPTDDEMDTVALADVNEWIMERVVSNQSTVVSNRWTTSPTAYSSN